MEKLIICYENFIKALNVFEETIHIFKREDIDEAIKSRILTALIKNNEMCYETALKFLDYYLICILGITIIGKDKSRNIIRECFVQKIIDQDTSQQLLNISTIRNATVHEYNEESILEHAKRIEHYFETFKEIQKNVKI